MSMSIICCRCSHQTACPRCALPAEDEEPLPDESGNESKRNAVPLPRTEPQVTRTHRTMVPSTSGPSVCSSATSVYANDSSVKCVWPQADAASWLSTSCLDITGFKYQLVEWGRADWIVSGVWWWHYFVKHWVLLMLSCTVMMQIHRYWGVLFVQVFSAQLGNFESVPVVPVCGKLYLKKLSVT